MNARKTENKNRWPRRRHSGDHGSKSVLFGDESTPEVEVIDTATGERVGRVINASRAGLLIVANRPFGEQERYRLRLFRCGGRTDESVELSVESIYSEPSQFSDRHGVGFAIIELHGGDLDRLFPSAANARFGIPTYSAGAGASPARG